VVTTATAGSPIFDPSPARGPHPMPPAGGDDSPREAPGSEPSREATPHAAARAQEQRAAPSPPSADKSAVSDQGGDRGGDRESAASAATQIRAESEALRDARATLRGGNAAGALAQLEALDTRFPHPKLAQEREVLMIESLYRAGHRDAARARAQAFLRATPTSPHAARVQTFAQ